MKSRSLPKSKLSGKRRPVVLVSSPTYLPRSGGSSTYFSTLIELLKDRVDFVVYSMRCPEADTVERNGNVWIYRIQPNLIDSNTLIKYLVVPPATLATLLAFKLRFRPQVIHAHANGVFGFTASIFSKLMKLDMIKEVQDMSDPAYNLKMGRVEKYVSTGYTIEKKLIDIGIPAEDIITYPSLNPKIDEDVKRTLKPKKHIHDGDIELLCISALRPYKGVDILLRAFKIISAKRKNVYLTIIGEGGMREELEEYIKSNNLERVTMIPRLDEYSDLIKRMAGCDILVLSSRAAEGNPRVILESFQFERPVVVTAAGGTPELINDGENGFLVEIENPEKFAEAVIKLVDNPKLRKKFGKNGKKFLERIPSWEDLAEDIYKEYMALSK
ncbi:MAG: glycosyltransferase family 4 protein [Thermoplasmata archaeon]|nr:MAG: glycosyltransferase family 4 protein [Thermoplasmata archaeon]